MADRVSERQLLDELEVGKADNVPAFFKGQFEEERIASVNRLRETFLQDVKNGRAKPDLLNFDVRHFFRENVTISHKGSIVYSDSFDPWVNTHSSKGDVTPASRKEFDPQELKRLTSQVEQGNYKPLVDTLSGLYYEEQASVLRSVQKINRQNRLEHATEAMLSFDYGGNKENRLSLRFYRAANNNMLTPWETAYRLDIESDGKRNVYVGETK